MNAITTSTPGYAASTASDLGRAARRPAAPATTSAPTPAGLAAQQIESANRAAAIGCIDDLAGAEAAIAQMRLAFSTQPAEARAAQGTPSAANALRLLGT